MRIKGILVYMLCIVIAFGIMPGVSAFASETGLYSSIEEIMGVDEVSCQAYQHQFIESYSHTDAGHFEREDYPGRVTYTADGMSFPVGKVTLWRLTPSISPFYEENATLFTAKFLSENERFEFQLQNPTQEGRVYLSVTPSSVKANGAVVTKEMPADLGTDWFDLLVHSTTTGHRIFVRNTSTNQQWKLLLNMNGFRSGSVAAGKLCVAGTANTGFLVKSIAVYKEVKQYQSIEEILGSKVSSTYAFEFDKTFDTTVASPTRAGIRYPQGIDFTEDGLTLSGVADSTSANNYGVWNFMAFNKWSPLNENNPSSTEEYVGQAFYTKIKGKINFQLRAPGSASERVYIDSYPGKNLHCWSNNEVMFHKVIQPDENWIEYLVVPREKATNGYTLYAKSDTLTDGSWLRVLETSSYQGSGHDAVGIQFSNIGYVKEARALQMGSVSDKETKPKSATLLSFEEEFSKMPTDTNCTVQNMTVADGVATFPASSSVGNGKYLLNQVEIPVDGYAEFQSRTNGVANYIFDDGTQKMSIYLPKDYGSVSGGYGRICDGSNTWRTYRVLRSKDGYSVYSKTDGDNAWLVHAVDAGEAGSGTPGISMEFLPHYNGVDVGSSQVDYLRIYAFSPSGTLILTDGDTNIEVSEEQELLYPETIYAKVQPDPENDRKLIYAEYGRDDVLTKIETTKISAGNELFTKVFDLSDPEAKVRRYQFFLWDSASGITPESSSKVVRGNLWSWADHWSVIGSATRSDGELLLNSKYGKEASAEYSNAVGDQYDIAWKMTLDDFNGTKTVRVYTGSHLTEIDIKEDGITYLTDSGEKTVPWPLDTKEHLYRLIGNGGTVSLLIDGYHVIKMEDVVSNMENAKIQIQNISAGNQASSLSISYFESKEYSGENLPVEGYYDTFDTGDNGWYVPDSEGFAWKIADGSLQVYDMLISKSHPYAQKEIPVADDYTFTTRIKVESFGTTANLYFYTRNYVIDLNLRQMFLAMETIDGQVAYSDEIKIDTAKWYNLRLETYNNCKNVRVYLDGVKVAESETTPISKAYMYAKFQANGGYQEPFIIKLDWFHCAPKQYGVSITSPLENAVYQEGDSISLDAVNAVATGENVKYLINNKVVASGSKENNAALLTGLPAGTYEIKAVSGTDISNPVLFKVQKDVETGSLPQIGENESYANEISYTADGDGLVQVGNGRHLFQMSHSGGKVTYLTDTGEETYDYGTGDFYAVTEGPVADVYRNGQFVFSFFMPMAEEVVSDFVGALMNGSVMPSGERKTYFSAKNVTGQKNVYRLSNLPSSHVLDFVADSSDEVHLVLNDGYYRNDISIENGNIYLWNGQRNNSVVKKIKALTMEDREVYYRVETSAGISRIYANGRFITTFRGGVTVGKNTLSVEVKSGSLRYLAVCDNVDLYLHQDDFSGNGELNSVDYWMTSNATVRVNDVKQNLFMETSENGFAELSPSCGNVELSANVTVDSADGFWIVNNHVVTESYNRAGYNFSTGQYEIADVVKSEVKDVVAKAGTFPTGENVHMQVKVREDAEGERVTLYVNGEEVLSKVTEFNSRGRVGFLLSVGSATVDDVVFRGDAKPIVGQTDNTNTSGMTLDLIENYETGQVYMANSGSANVTSDGGKTWETFTPQVNQGLAADRSGGMSQHMLQLSDGTVLSASVYGNTSSMKDEYGQGKYVYRVYKSTDYGMTWEQFTTNEETFPSIAEAAVGENATVNALKQGNSGRIYFVKQKDTNEDYGGLEVWYSNNGKNWFRSETEIRAKKLGFVIAEGVVIETRKFTRLYFRTDMGALGYFNSYDLGETWDLTPHMTPFISSACCFNIDVDPEDPDTLYAAWIYDNVNLFARHQFPRTRWSVAKSTDGGENWEMIGTVHENNSYYTNNMNMNIAVSSEHVYVSAYSSDHYKAVNPYCCRILSFPKDSQRTSKRFEQVHMQYPTQVDNTKVMGDNLQERTMAVHPDSGAIWLRGERIEEAVSGEYIDTFHAAALVGATVETGTDGSVVFSIGDGSSSVGAEECKTVAGKTFVKISSFAEEFGLSIVEEGNVKLISENGDWSVRQKKAFRYAVDLFSNQP